MAKDTPPAVKDELLPNDVIKHFLLSDIFVDYEWNSRSKAEITEINDAVVDTTVGGQHQPQGAKFEDFMMSFFDRGQDTPVFVRKVEGGKSLAGKKTDKPYELVSGFRRYTAIERLNAPGAEIKIGDGDKAEVFNFAKRAGELKRNIVPNTANGTILAVVRDLDPLQARLLNARENTQRKNLSTPDTVRLVQELAAAKMNQVKIATELGIGQPYVSRLSRIASLPTDVIAHWSGRVKTLPGLNENTVYRQMTTKELVDLADSMENRPAGEVTARYVNILNPPPPAEGSEGSAGEENKQIAKIEEQCKLFGKLVRAGILENGSLEWSRVIGPKKLGFLIDSGTKPNAEGQMQLSKIWDIAERAFKQGIDEGGQPAVKSQNGGEVSASA